MSSTPKTATGNEKFAKNANGAMSFNDFMSQQQTQRKPLSVATPKRVATPLASTATSGASTPALSSRNSSSTSLASLNTALSKLAVSPLTPHIEAINAAGTIGEIRAAIEEIIAVIGEYGISFVAEWDLVSTIKTLSKAKNPALIREAAAMIIAALARHVLGVVPNEAHLVALLPLGLDLLSDKENAVKRAAQGAVDAIAGLFPTEANSSVVFPALLAYLASSAKWNTKLAALKLVDKIIATCPADLMEITFAEGIPVLTDLSTDFKPELAAAGLKTLGTYVQVLDNLDLQTRYSVIVETLADPTKVPGCIKAFSSVTFVSEVTEPALALLVPILDKSLKMSSSSQDQLRQTVTVTENLTRLVNNKREIERYIPVLLPGIRKVVKGAALPEVRDLAEKALAVLEAAEAEHSDGKFHGRITKAQAEAYVDPAFAQDPLVFHYLATIIATDANVNDWARLREFLDMASPQTLGDAAPAYVESVVLRLRELFVPDAANPNADDGIEIVNSDFSLAYGLRMLLNKTNLRLLKGHRYGLCGRNGAGKSTLMRAIATGKLEGFPDKSELRTCFVEHSIQGEEGDMDLVSFIAKDENLALVTRDDITKALLAVGFPDSRLTQNVGALLGGWKMKLELARAMLLNADVLLLDEPTNHLDVANVKWLEDYLVENTEITSLIVSHDSGFLDSVCTDIIHYENKKLAYYKGNLLKFVEQKPEGKSYYTLTDLNVKMAFPPAGILTGVKSQTRAVARMTDVTFAYPGAAAPSLVNVSASLTLSSRVAVLGPNGAGKSTLIKLLTGDLTPDKGHVEKHPNLRIGYIAQHALAHVETHKEKTANQYLQWRYKFGDDREVLMKESRRLTASEAEMMAKEIDMKDERGPRTIEAIVGRQKLKKSFQYEIKWNRWLPRYNSWVPREFLVEEGFAKLVQKFDDHEASREGLGYRELTPKVIRKHFEDVGLDGDIADHTPMGSLSGGQLVKVVIAGAMWNNPHLLVLDEPTNYLDRDSLGGLAVAIRDWNGGVVMISHNNEFVGALCPEQWTVENGEVVQKGSATIDNSRFQDGGESATAKPVSKARADDNDSPANIKIRERKKKMTRNEKKLQEERRRLRHINWLNTPKGTPKPADTDDEEE